MLRPVDGSQLTQPGGSPTPAVRPCPQEGRDLALLDGWVSISNSVLGLSRSSSWVRSQATPFVSDSIPRPSRRRDTRLTRAGGCCSAGSQLRGLRGWLVSRWSGSAPRWHRAPTRAPWQSPHPVRGRRRVMGGGSRWCGTRSCWRSRPLARCRSPPSSRAAGKPAGSPEPRQPRRGARRRRYPVPRGRLTSRRPPPLRAPPYSAGSEPRPGRSTLPSSNETSRTPTGGDAVLGVAI
jgi:hypothetical protein